MWHELLVYFGIRKRTLKEILLRDLQDAEISRQDVCRIKEEYASKEKMYKERIYRIKGELMNAINESGE